MNTFTASNGITVYVREGGTVQFQHGTREESCGILQIFPHSEWWETLREFFRAEDAEATPSAEDVREAGARIILDNFHAPDARHSSWWLNPYEMFDALAAAGLVVRPRGTVTDADEKDRLLAEYHDRAIRAEATAREALTRAQALANWRGTVTEDPRCDYSPREGFRCFQRAGHGGIGHLCGDVEAAAGVVSPRLEYTIAAELENGAITQLADYTTVVRDHLKADLELYRIEEERAKGDPERIFIAQRPIPKWVRSATEGARS